MRPPPVHRSYEPVRGSACHGRGTGRSEMIFHARATATVTLPRSATSPIGLQITAPEL